MRVRAPAFPSSTFVLYTRTNKLLHLVCNLCSHSLLVVLNFTVLEPFVFIATPFWWCELFLSLSDSFHSPTLLFGVAKRSRLIVLSLSLSLLFGDAKGSCLLWACSLVAKF
jgi:hypothetical protein